MMLILLNFLLAQAHVRMFYDSSIASATPHAIRNSGTTTGNGGMSTAGPCGGAEAWGGTSGNQFTDASVGDRVALKIQYNGGHKSAENQFTVRWKCGTQSAGPTETDMKADDTLLAEGVCSVLSCPTANAYPCPASDGNNFEPGYIFECTIPNEAAGQYCTYSVLDQREWGGCVDLRVSNTIPESTMPEATPDPNTPQETPGIEEFPSSFTGTFKFYGADIDETSPKYESCCCTMDEGSTSKNTFEVSETGLLTGNFNIVCPAAVTTARGLQSSATNLNIQLTYGGVVSWKGEAMIQGQEMTFEVVDGDTLYYSNTGKAEPMICDGYIRQDGTGSGDVLTAPDQCETLEFVYSRDLWNGVSSWSVVGLFALVLALF